MPMFIMEYLYCAVLFFCIFDKVQQPGFSVSNQTIIIQRYFVLKSSVGTASREATANISSRHLFVGSQQ